MKCLKCNTEIKPEYINTIKGVAKCSNCGGVFTFATKDLPQTNFDVNLPPKGTWHTNDFATTKVGATTRSSSAFFIVPFLIIWSGLAFGGIYGSQIVSGKFNIMMSLFGIPFVVAAITFSALAMMSVFGKVEVVFDNVGGKIFTGVGNIGYTIFFTWDDVNRIDITESSLKYNDKNASQISLIGQKVVSFGTVLNKERRSYVYRVLSNYLQSLKR